MNSALKRVFRILSYFTVAWLITTIALNSRRCADADYGRTNKNFLLLYSGTTVSSTKNYSTTTTTTSTTTTSTRLSITYRARSYKNPIQSKHYKNHSESSPSLLRCLEEASNVTQLVNDEMSKHIRVKHGFPPFGPFVGDMCTPVYQHFSCSMLNSSIPCSQDLLVEHFHFHHQHHCLLRIAEEVQDARPTLVPRLLHSVWYYSENAPFRFHQYIGLLSLVRFFKPSVIFLWNGGNLPTGKWWHEFLAHIQSKEYNTTIQETYEFDDRTYSVNRTVYIYNVRIISVFRDPPSTIYGTKVERPEHFSDIVRMEALLLYGGMYGDTDIIAIRSFDKILNFTTTMGRDAPSTVSNGVIFSFPQSPYLYILHASYRTFVTTEWSTHSTVGNQYIYSRCPDLLHVESDSLIVPGYFQRTEMFEPKIHLNLDNAFSIHIWWRHIPFDPNPMLILRWKCTTANVLRNIYFGLCSDFCGGPSMI